MIRGEQDFPWYSTGSFVEQCYLHGAYGRFPLQLIENQGSFIWCQWAFSAQTTNFCWLRHHNFTKHGYSGMYHGWFMRKIQGIFSNSMINGCYHAMTHPLLSLFEDLYSWDFHDHGWFYINCYKRSVNLGIYISRFARFLWNTNRES